MVVEFPRTLTILPGTTVIFASPGAYISVSGNYYQHFVVRGGNVSDPATRITFVGANIAQQGLLH